MSRPDHLVRHSIDVTDALQQSLQVCEFVEESLVGLSIKGSRRSKIAVGCLRVALEHSHAILILVSTRHFGSAFALMRLLFEAHIREVWIHHCATDQQLEDFLEDTVPKFGIMIESVEKNEAYKAGIFSELKSKAYFSMNSFTHTGFSQVLRQYSEDNVIANYRDEEILELINFSAAASILSGIAIATVAEDLSLALKLLDVANNFAKSTYNLSESKEQRP